MSNPKEVYTKEISSIYTSTPDQVQFNHKEFNIQKTWKIGVKKDCDMTREEFIQELENVNMLDVNHYKVNQLKSQVKSFVLENDLQQFNTIVHKLRT